MIVIVIIIIVGRLVGRHFTFPSKTLDIHTYTYAYVRHNNHCETGPGAASVFLPFMEQMLQLHSSSWRSGEWRTWNVTFPQWQLPLCSTSSAVLMMILFVALAVGRKAFCSVKRERERYIYTVYGRSA